MRPSRILLLILFPSLTLLSSCGGGGGGGGSTGSNQQAGAPGPGAGSGDSGSGQQDTSGDRPSGGDGGNGPDSGSDDGSGEDEGGQSSGEDESNGDEGGAVAAAMPGIEQQGGKIHVDLEVMGEGTVTLITTEGDHVEQTEVSTSGLSQVSFTIPRRGTPLELRSMQVEAVDSTGKLLAMRQFEAIEPLDLPRRSLLALNQADENSLRTRVATPGRADRVIEEMTMRLDTVLSDPLYVPATKGSDSRSYTCPDHLVPLQVVAGDPSSHECSEDGHVYHAGNTEAELYADIIGAYNSKVHRDLANDAFEFGVGYVVTDNLAYANRAAAMLLEYADHYDNYPLTDRKGTNVSRATSKVLSQSLDEARWLAQLARGFDLVRGSGALTRAEEVYIADHLLRPSMELLRGKRDAWGYHNIQCWHNTAVFLAAMQIGEFEAAREALHAQYGLLDQMSRAASSEAFWGEGSFGYHYFAVRAMMPMLQGMRRTGIYEDDTTLRSMMLVPLQMMQPDGSMPMFNDGAYKSLATNLKDLYEQAAGLFDDPEIAGPIVQFGRGNTVEGIIYGLKSVQEGGWADPTSVNMQITGLASLRSGDLADQTVAMVDYGPHGGDHGHNDKFGLTLWMNGVQLLGESGHIGYVDPYYKGYYKRTLAHSTIVRDGLDQEPLDASASVDKFETLAGASTLVVDSDVIYPGSSMRRMSHTTGNGRYVDMFEATGDDSHTWDYVLHINGMVTTDLPMANVANHLGFGGAYSFLSSMEAGASSNDVEFHVVNDAGSHTIRILGAPGTEYALGEAIGFPNNKKHAVIVARRTGSSAVFAMLATEGQGLPAGLNIGHVPGARSLTLEEPESGSTVVLSLE